MLRVCVAKENFITGYLVTDIQVHDIGIFHADSPDYLCYGQFWWRFLLSDCGQVCTALLCLAVADDE